MPRADCIRGTVQVRFYSDVLRIRLLEKRVHFFVCLLHCGGGIRSVEENGIQCDLCGSQDVGTVIRDPKYPNFVFRVGLFFFGWLRFCQGAVAPQLFPRAAGLWGRVAPIAKA